MKRIHVRPWFERRFDFPIPIELYPNLYARLRGTPSRLEEIFQAISSSLRLEKNGREWSIQEHAGHLLDLEPLWIARVADYAADNTRLTPTDLRNQKTFDANHNASTPDQVLSAFRDARLQMLQQVEKLDGISRERSILHPRLQTPMRLMDHLYFVAEHDDHHLAQMWTRIHAADKE
jgi:uncharacterized damage-inducible protein DinB